MSGHCRLLTPLRACMQLYIFDNEATVAYAFFMSIWATLFHANWLRHEAEVGSTCRRKDTGMRIASTQALQFSTLFHFSWLMTGTWMTLLTLSLNDPALKPKTARHVSTL